MKLKKSSFPKNLSLCLGPAVAFLSAAQFAQATNVYWDTNGATAGASTASTTANGTWDAATTGNWSTSSAGTVGTSTYSTANGGSPSTADVFFSAGTNATGASTITINSQGTGTGVTANSITIEEGAIATATSGTFGSGPVLTLGSGGLTLASTSSGNSSFGANTTLSLSASQTWTTDSASNFTASGLATVNTSNMTFTRAGAGAGIVSLAGGLSFNSTSGTTFALAGTTAANTSIGGTITFASGTSAMTASGTALTLAGGITNSSGVLQTINNDIALSTATHAITATSGDIALGGAFSGGSSSVTFSGPGTTTLSGTNAFNLNQGNFGQFTVGASAAAPGFASITGATTLSSTGTASTSGGSLVIQGTSTLTIQTGGSLTVNAVAGASPGSSIIGQNATSTASTLLVNGGTLTVSGAQGFVIGNSNGTTTGVNGVLTISSGTATINRSAVGASNTGDTRLIQMGRDRADTTGTINLNGGTLATDRQFVRDGSNGAASGIANFVFGGGTLKALGAQTDWLQSTTATSAGQGGGTVNANALALSSVTTTAVSTIDANSFSVAINSAISGAGGFNINSSTGTGTVTFGGVNTYNGATTISAGQLNVIGSINSSAVSIGAATLGGNGSVGAVTANNVGSIVTNGSSNTAKLTLASLAFSASGAVNLNLSDLNIPIAVTNTLAIGPGFTVNVTTAPSWVNGLTYNLIDYGTLSGTPSNIIKGTISGLGARQIATLGNTGSTNGSITLAITGNTPVWTGIQSNAWTTAIISGSKNWKLLTGGAATDFVSNDQVIFDDSATGTTGVDISTANVQVASAVFSNDSLSYTISSAGGFGIADGTSPGSLSKSGAGPLTLNTVNSYTGFTHIESGATLQLGDGTTNGDIATSSVITNDGSLVYNRTGSSFSYANVISGSGSLVKDGTGTQIVSGSNTYSGGTTINGGTLQVGSGGTTGKLGTGAITNNGTLVFNRTNAVVQGTDFGLIDGTGSVTQAGSGAITVSFGNSYSGGTNINSGSLIVGATNALGTGSVTLAGGTLSGTTGADITLANALVAQASTTSVLTTNGKNLTLNGNLTGSGDINRTPTGAAASVFLGGDNSGFSGTFTVDSNAAAATRFSVATAGSQAAKWVINQSSNTRASLDFTGGTIKFGSLTGTGFLTSQGAAGINTIEVGNLGLSETFSGVLNQAVSTLAVTKIGAGTWTLTGVNTYTGDTTVNAGVLAVNGNAIANANKLVINGGKVASTGTEVVNTLFFGATQQASGTWGATGSGATHIDDVHFSGTTGVVSVTTAPVAGYTTWANANGATGQTVDQDHDNDGVKNGIEYFMGATGSTFTANPALVGGSTGTVTWPMGSSYANSANYGTSYLVQTSPDLVTWTQAPQGSGPNTVTVTAGVSVVYTMPSSGTKLFVRLVVNN